MVLAYHIIITAYGFWLPNDPRGSWSDFVAAWELRRFGPATKVTTRASLAYKPHDWKLRLEAKKALKYPPVSFTGAQCAAIASGFADSATSAGYKIHACSILPEHVHMVIARHERDIEVVASHLKSRANLFMADKGLHPFQNTRDKYGVRHTPWTERFWPVYLDSPADIWRAIRYVQNNPIKGGKRGQGWWFITPYLG